MSQEIDQTIISELNGINQGKIDAKQIKTRKNMLDNSLNDMISEGIIEKEGNKLTPTFEKIWEELQKLQELQTNNNLLKTISAFNDDMVLLGKEASKYDPTKSEYEENNVLDLLQKMCEKSSQISKMAQNVWKNETQISENSVRYFDNENISKIAENISKILDSVLHFAIENIKWPLQYDQNSEIHAILKKVFSLCSLDIYYDTKIPALKSFNQLITNLPKYAIKHYIQRLKNRIEFHFLRESDPNKNERPELILAYAFDQIRILKQYLESLGCEKSFDIIKEQVLNEIMSILIMNYKKISGKLKETIRLFFIFLEEVSMFQARLNVHFGYICDEQHSLFYYILNDNLCGKSVTEVWKNVDKKLAEKRIGEILFEENFEEKTGEEIESLLEHFVKSYSTLPLNLRENFFGNSEEFILKRLISEFGKRVYSMDYWKILKKQFLKTFLDFAISLDRTIKGVKRQKEIISLNFPKIRDLYQTSIDDLLKTRQQMNESAALCITRSLLLVLQKDFEKTSSGTPKEKNKFMQDVQKIVDSLFKKFIDVDLTQNVLEIQMSILKQISRHLGGENWTKVLAKFQKDSIKQQFFDMIDMFQGCLSKTNGNLNVENWKNGIEQELSK